MDTDIRKYIKNNFKNCTEEDVKNTVLASVNSDDEVVLPGLGVLFEMLWNNSDDISQNNIVNILFNDAKKA
jgi:small acid-soluble spore protein I (minor)